MWIEKTKKGFRAVERYTDPLTGKVKKASVSMEKNTATTRKIAEKILAEKIHDKSTQMKAPVELTVQDAVDAWQERNKVDVKESTQRTYKTQGKQVTRILGSDTLLNSLSAPYVNKVLGKTLKDAHSRNLALKRIKNVLRFAYANDMISDIAWLDKLSPAKDDSKDDVQDKYMEKEELQVLVDGLPSEKWRDLTLFLALTGMRIGEALALSYQDIDMGSRIIHIGKTYNSDLDIVLTAKTSSSHRDIYIQDELLPLCRKLYTNASHSRFVSGLLFPRSTYNAYACYLKRYSMAVLDRHIKPHYLRHTHVALLAEQGLSLELISRRLGHENSDLTKKIYFHVTQRLKEKDFEKIKSINIM